MRNLRHACHDVVFILSSTHILSLTGQDYSLGFQILASDLSSILKSATNADSDCSGKVYLCFDNQSSIAPNEESLKIRALALHRAAY